MVKDNIIKKVKSTNNRKLKGKEKDYPEYLDYFNVFTMRYRPISDAWIEKLAEEIIIWSKEPKSLKFMQFLSRKGIPTSSFYGWLKRSEALAAAHKFAIITIGSRREMGGLTREFDSAIVRATMPIYDPDWKRLEEWRSDLKQKENDSDKPKIVVIEKFPDESKITKVTPEEAAKKASMKGTNRSYVEPRGI